MSFRRQWAAAHSGSLLTSSHGAGFVLVCGCGVCVGLWVQGLCWVVAAQLRSVILVFIYTCPLALLSCI